ncbi:selenium-binding protein SBP56-related protein [Candidatus Methylacidithermus pantelleriae]|uniref:Methanethiol oxidase n=1 Tax=Candidatus Methylacidithermus pantelleriae TaxID=2744239 RepID=A0A8J2BM29_9BACT|nr:selenium-binding protein SBP56-related protein [Candidatus Methylacidithermus pantelleriae]CAF0695024.1 Methanethiol oxidase [Candidatus Methylacidithermus pantelleriae]
MPVLRPDPTFYPSARLARLAPQEKLAYVVAFSPSPLEGTTDRLTVVDVNPDSPDYGKIVGELVLPGLGHELHHFGWNACSSALCPYAPHPHLERRYLIIPGLRSSDIHIVDTKPDVLTPKLVKTIGSKELLAKTGYSRPHTVHCGPDGIYVSALGGEGNGGPGGIFILDHFSFDVLGPWEIERANQYLAYDFWWHLNWDMLVSSEWGTPELFENGVVPEKLLAGQYGHKLHFWDLRHRRHFQEVDLGKEHQMVLELRPAHDPRKTYGFAGVVISLENLSSSIWLWYRQDDQWKAQKVIEIPAEPADPQTLPPILQGFGLLPPLVTDLNLSLDDRFLLVSAWGKGELLSYDVTDPFHPRLVDRLSIGGIVHRRPHPSQPDRPLSGGPQMVEVSRDGQRVYLTNSLYSTWDDQFYPQGLEGWLVKITLSPEGRLAWDERFFVEFGKWRPHQVRLQGGDSSSDSFCYP